MKIEKAMWEYIKSQEVRKIRLPKHCNTPEEATTKMDTMMNFTYEFYTDEGKWSSDALIMVFDKKLFHEFRSESSQKDKWKIRYIDKDYV